MNINNFFSIQDKKDISDAVNAVETTTSGEIVTVFANRSGRYVHIDLVFSVFLAYFIVAVSYFLYFDFYSKYFILLHVSGFILGLLFCRITFVKRLMLPKAVTKNKVAKEAFCTFYEYNLFNTKDRTGILIYISLLEKQVFVLGDTGINTKVDASMWQHVVEAVILGIKQKKYTQGIINAIHLCGDVLKLHFPIKINDTNELCNELVIKVK